MKKLTKITENYSNFNQNGDSFDFLIVTWQYLQNLMISIHVIYFTVK